ncbi:metalloregulator ArsR/SmtB family transcription factor [Christensenellaceae bacterium OttesenSCG-928-K19]|nr:metalloregulator ArsR/SmtB family transcription factor [Christensenellaceae bacterium OttesenSCG-928-K19]
MHEECKRSAIEVNSEDEERVCGLFKTLGEASRLRIVCALMNTQMCVAHLAEAVEMEQSAVSHQLRNLKAANLVKSEKKGKQVFYSLDDGHVFGIISQAIEHAKHMRGGQ